MKNIASTTMPFLPIGMGNGVLELRCTRTFPMSRITVRCADMLVGKKTTPTVLAAGESVSIPIYRLPHIMLPGELQVFAGAEDRILCAPIPIESAQAALELLGPPLITVERLNFENNILTGTLRESRNGMLDPVLSARVNGRARRSVFRGSPVGLSEGGCIISFELPLAPTDFELNRASIVFFMDGIHRHIFQHIVDLSNTTAIEQSSTRIDATADKAYTYSSATETHRIGEFRANLVPGHINSRDSPASTQAVSDHATPASVNVETLKSRTHQIEVAPDAKYFGDGWHKVEADVRGLFRWMAGQSFIATPTVLRPLAAVSLEVVSIKGAVTPSLSARLDQTSATVTVEATAGGSFNVTIIPVIGPAQFRYMILKSSFSATPAHADAGQIGDKRNLSISVSRVVFYYT